jgi:hypothetical protein
MGSAGMGAAQVTAAGAFGAPTKTSDFAAHLTDAIDHSWNP